MSPVDNRFLVGGTRYGACRDRRSDRIRRHRRPAAPRPREKGDSKLATLLAAAVGAVPGGVERPGQQAMAEAIAEAERSDRHLLVQAGTGTGKSLAYLVPALLVEGPVVVSTATLALQSQLDRPRPAPPGRRGRADPRPAPDLRRAQGPPPLRVPGEAGEQHGGGARRAVRRRHRSGRRRWRQVAGRDRPAGQADRAAARLGAGDRDGRPRRARPGRRRHRVAAGLDAGAGVRRRAALPVRHGVLRRGVPGAGPGVRHRGHQPQPARLRHAGQPPHRAAAPAARHRRGARAGRPGLLGGAGRADGRRRRARGPPGPQPDRRRRARGAGRGRRHARGRRSPTRCPAASRPACRRPCARRSPCSTRRPGAASRRSATSRPTTPIRCASSRRRPAWPSCPTRRSGCWTRPTHDVAWVDQDDRGRRAVVVAPLSVAGTLAVAPLPGPHRGGHVGHAGARRPVRHGRPVARPARPGRRGRRVRRRRRPTPTLHSGRSLDVGSPFDYPKQGILYVAAHLPRPTQSGLSDAAADELVELVTALGGRTLGLFSSRRAAERAAEVVRGRTDLHRAAAGRGVAAVAGAPVPRRAGELPVRRHVAVAGRRRAGRRVPARRDRPAAVPASRRTAGGGAVRRGRRRRRLGLHRGQRAHRGGPAGAGRRPADPVRGPTGAWSPCSTPGWPRRAATRTYLRDSLPPLWYTTKPDVVRALCAASPPPTDVPAPPDIVDNGGNYAAGSPRTLYAVGPPGPGGTRRARHEFAGVIQRRGFLAILVLLGAVRSDRRISCTPGWATTGEKAAQPAGAVLGGRSPSASSRGRQRARLQRRQRRRVRRGAAPAPAPGQRRRPARRPSASRPRRSPARTSTQMGNVVVDSARLDRLPLRPGHRQPADVQLRRRVRAVVAADHWSTVTPHGHRDRHRTRSAPIDRRRRRHAAHASAGGRCTGSSPTTTARRSGRARR